MTGQGARLWSRAGLLALSVALPAVLPAVLPAPARAESPLRVLILHSFGPRFAPFESFAADFRGQLTRRAPEPLDIYEASLETARFAAGGDGAALAAYLDTLFAAGDPDLVVTFGGAAAQFVQSRRAAFFPGSPLLMTAAEEARVDPALLTPQDAVALFQLDLPAAIEDILTIEPDTRRIFVVLGATPLERFWRAEAERRFARFAGRVSFEWSNGLNFDQILARVAALPADAAVVYGLMLVDAAGAPFEEGRAVAALSQASAAPVFGLYDSQIGQGILGGRVLPVAELAAAAADIATRLLAGAPPEGARPPAEGFGPPAFDSRQLVRFGIPESRLPPGSRVLFRAPGAWQTYRWQILGAAALCLVQFAFILGLLANRRRLGLSRAALVASEDRAQRAADSARDFAGRLINAQEAERSRLARELHDDVTQRLAGLAIEAGRHEMRGGGEAPALAALRAGLARLSEDVHALSYRLHPSILADLGLVAALEAEVERLADAEELWIDFAARDVPERLPPAVSVCLYRVAQEALRNVLRHARATRAQLRLWGEPGALCLTVADDGLGFAPEAPRARPSLGLASMRQRVAALGGDLAIQAAPGRGARIEVRIPMEEDGDDAPAPADR